MTHSRALFRAIRSLSISTSSTLVILLAPVACATPDDDHENSILVFAASDLQPALPEIVRLYQANGGVDVVVSLGSSGNLATQIRHGAPADLYLSANETFVDALIELGLIDGASRTVYGVGRLALVAAGGLPIPAALDSLLSDRYRVIAIANPDHAPYGLAAREALVARGIWEGVTPRLVFAENIVQAHQFVSSGSADAGIVALSLVLASAGTPYSLIDDALHAPIRQTGGVVAGRARASAARDFLRLVASPAGQEVLSRFGFEPATSP